MTDTRTAVTDNRVGDAATGTHEGGDLVDRVDSVEPAYPTPTVPHQVDANAHRRPPQAPMSPSVPPIPPHVPAPSPVPTDEQDRTRLARLHESMAGLHASRGQWQKAYTHLRSALDLTVTHSDRAPVPDQLRHEVDELRREHAKAREQSLRDSLTASYNRRYLDEQIGGLLAERTGPGLAVALVDLDYFKQVNDTYGHLLGDRVLQQVVEVLQHGLPEGAFCVRFGGEEFVLVLPSVTPEAAVEVSEAARARVEDHHWDRVAGGLRVTVSIGVAHHRPAGTDPAAVDPVGSVVHRLLHRADELLYCAKQGGRNAVAHRDEDLVSFAGAASGRRGSGVSLPLR